MSTKFSIRIQKFNIIRLLNFVTNPYIIDSLRLVIRLVVAKFEPRGIIGSLISLITLIRPYEAN